ncbi:hypothetical protein AYI68_g6229 [Smittium mucronatum]|uniref:Uncharacterized protein n=1 Tax=Smittium mucronatum TaxID=133383 RepID=A0A1R0GS51_9FUNG|nr:hypothetical protein AYI68_g6229 [Smittium mucronatum]
MVSGSFSEIRYWIKGFEENKTIIFVVKCRLDIRRPPKAGQPLQKESTGLTKKKKTGPLGFAQCSVFIDVTLSKMQLEAQKKRPDIH